MGFLLCRFWRQNIMKFEEKDFEVHTYGFLATDGGSLGSFMKGITSPPLSKNWHPIASIAASDD